MDVRIENSWKEQLLSEFSKSYFDELTTFVRNEYQTQQVYPPGSQIFNAFDRCTFAEVKVVIVGQDPYHGVGQANGLCFSVADDIRFPPSLQNIFKELQADIGTPFPTSGNLGRWADQGVLLLNATLTVRASAPGSHQNKGWEEFTDSVLRSVSGERENVVFLLWGAYAQKKGALVDQEKHLILKAPHPSPFSAHSGFFGCNHFSKTNQFLAEKGLSTIAW